MHSSLGGSHRNFQELQLEFMPKLRNENGVKKPLDLTNDDFININVCGMLYETLESTLQRYPSTLLGNRERRKHYYVSSKGAYYFDRNRQCFEAILHYYQSEGTLIRPSDIPVHSFEKEISFFGLIEKEEEEEEIIRDKPNLQKEHLFNWQMKIWKLFEFPDSGLPARIIASWSLFVIALSITIFCMETMPVFDLQERKKLMRNASYYGGNIAEIIQPWFSLELGCIVWFTLEYVSRFICSPNKWKFVKSFLNLIDLLSILPYYITVCNHSGDQKHLSILRVVRLVRVFRIFKLSRHSHGLQILGHTLKASLSELGMLIFFLFLGVILFSSVIYYAEESTNDMFTSIPDAFWYSLVTMTTVGYGDKVPKTFIGKLIGTLCAVSGVLTIALPVPVIVSNFDYFYKKDLQNKQKAASTSEGPPTYCEVCIDELPNGSVSM